MDVDETCQNLVRLHEMLTDELKKLNELYLSQYLHVESPVPEQKPDWSYHSKALIVLSHAAFENYLESIARMLIENAVHEYLNNRNWNEVLLMFCWMRMELPKINSKDTDWPTNYDLFRKELEKSKSAYTTAIDQNHGISTKHLNSILRPVGLSLPKDIKYKELVDSLSELVSLRGEYAHLFREKGDYFQIQEIKTPENIQKTINNVLKLTHKLSCNAIQLVTSASDEKKQKYLSTLDNAQLLDFGQPRLIQTAPQGSTKADAK